MTPETLTPPGPNFCNVLVTAVPSSKPGIYTVTCFPEKIPVIGPTIVNFQLIAPTPADVEFLSKIGKSPSDKRQLSNPSVSTDGKMLTLSDVCTWMGEIDTTLYVTDKDKGDQGFDPQIRNDPRAI